MQTIAIDILHYLKSLVMKRNDDIDIGGALATAHDNHYIVDPDDMELTWDQTFDMLDIGIVPFQNLHRHSKMKKMRENFLQSFMFLKNAK